MLFDNERTARRNFLLALLPLCGTRFEVRLLTGKQLFQITE